MIGKAIEKGIEIVVVHHRNFRRWILGIPAGQMSCDLQPNGGLTRALFAKHDRRRRFRGITVNLVPGRMMRTENTVVLEHRIGLGIFFAKGIPLNSVMIEKLIEIHDRLRAPWFRQTRNCIINNSETTTMSTFALRSVNLPRQR